MTFVVVAFSCSFLLVATSISHILAQNGNETTTGPADEKCGTVINTGNYYAGTSKEIKSIIQGMQAQLSKMQEQVRECNKTGE